MRVLLDNNLSPRLGDLLEQSGWNARHVGAIGLRSADDRTVLRAALDDERILISADTDFGALLASTRAPGPSVVLVRRVVGRRVDDLAGLLLSNLPVVAEELSAGCIVVVGDESMRVRPLPI